MREYLIWITAHNVCRWIIIIGGISSGLIALTSGEMVPWTWPFVAAAWAFWAKK